MCRGDNACPVCLSIQVSVAHAKVGKRFHYHKSVACFFLSPSLSFPFPFPFPFPLPLSLSLSLSFSLSLSLPLGMSWKREYRYTTPIVKLGRESAYIYILDNKEYQLVQNPCALPFLFILRQQKRKRETGRPGHYDKKCWS